jgi:redox-sensitive bicupin YhaK (pirin superfamily)
VGWLDRPQERGSGALQITAADGGARVLLYAGEPTGEPIVQHGPFVADNRQDVTRLYEEFQAGRFPKMSELPAENK